MREEKGDVPNWRVTSGLNGICTWKYLGKHNSVERCPWKLGRQSREPEQKERNDDLRKAESADRRKCRKKSVLERRLLGKTSCAPLRVGSTSVTLGESTFARRELRNAVSLPKSDSNWGAPPGP
jgi:hypothetical protein